VGIRQKDWKKLTYEEGHVISEGAKNFQCKDCKYYMYYGNCLLIKGNFTPEMSCGFVVKIWMGLILGFPKFHHYFFCKTF
jgi:hypothetical protein